MLERLIRIFAPLTCLACGRETDEIVCTVCLDAVPRVPSRCYRCRAVSEAFETCAACRRSTPLVTVIPFSFHRDLIKECIHAFKYERVQSAADTIAPLLWRPEYLKADSIIVPVPTANARIRSRGYDHAKLLARAMGIATRTPVFNTLRRLGRAHQVGSNRQQRLRQLEGTLYAHRPADIHGRHVVLVDDVMTTGATLETAAHTLKRAGAASVSAVVIAQA